MQNEAIWKNWQKITFRFFFFFLGIMSLEESTYLVLRLYYYFSNAEYTLFDKIYEALKMPFFWLDKNLYHTGFNPLTSETFFDDNHFGVIWLATVSIVSALSTLVWSFFYNNRPNYTKLFFWFRLYLRYCLSAVMFGYGMMKVFPTQMQLPDIADLHTGLGDMTKFKLLWVFMGASQGYEIFVGCLEVLAAILLLSKRTKLLGLLLTLILMVNIVAYNYFYNTSVKLYSSSLLLIVVFLIFPFFHKLFLLFLKGESVSLQEKEYIFTTKWKSYLLKGILIFCPFIYMTIFSCIVQPKRYANRKLQQLNQKNYEVDYFVSGDTIPPLTTDTVRWQRLCLIKKNEAVLFNMKNKEMRYGYKKDTTNKIFILYNNPDSTTWLKFSYANPTQNKFMLKGIWKNKPVEITLREIPIDSFHFKLLNTKFKWISND